jgi:hypothetical protein
MAGAMRKFRQAEKTGQSDQRMIETAIDIMPNTASLMMAARWHGLAGHTYLNCHLQVTTLHRSKRLCRP